MSGGAGSAPAGETSAAEAARGLAGTCHARPEVAGNVAAEHELAVTVHSYLPDAAGQALRDPKAGRFDGAAVLTP